MKKFKYLFRRQQIPTNKARFRLHTIVLAENNKQRGGSTEKHTTHNHPHRHAPVAPTHSRNPAQAPESVFSWIKAFESGGTLTPCLNSKFRKKKSQFQDFDSRRYSIPVVLLRFYPKHQRNWVYKTAHVDFATGVGCFYHVHITFFANTAKTQDFSSLYYPYESVGGKAVI